MQPSNEQGLAEQIERLESELDAERTARAQAEENDRFKHEFLGILSHDLRNPLNTVLTTARLLLMRKDLPEEVMKRIDRLIVSGVRMQRMIEQVLDVTGERMGEGVFMNAEPDQDVAAIVERVVDDARLAYPTRRLDALLDGGCSASVDRGRIEQVVRCLVNNALNHGAVDRPVRVAVLARERAVLIEVQNEGIPIDEVVQKEIFEPFRRGRAQGPSEGLGLGLHISKRIVRAHHGDLELESSLERGTRFRVRLPRGTG